MKNKPKKINKTKANFLLDIVLFFVFLTTYDPDITGDTLHEWMGLGFGTMIVVHLLMHWKWIVQVTKRFFGKLPTKTRINYILNLLLFIDVVNIGFSGMMISESVLPTFGFRGPGTDFWENTHEMFAEASIVLVGAHLALHWKWLLNAAKRFVLTPLDLVSTVTKRKPQLQTIQQKEI